MVNTRSASRAGSVPVTPAATPAKAPRRTTRHSWSYTPTATTLLWLAVSVPLVAWDVGYMLLRPHTMEGGALHWPVWAPYTLYADMDHIYGWKAINSRNGFAGGQSALNAIESAMYLWCAYTYFGKGVAAERGVAATRTVSGRDGAACLLVGFSAAVMTLSKTVLYWLCEYYSGFDNVGHNSMPKLALWLFLNGLWLVFPAYMVYSMGNDILDGIEARSAHKSE